LKRRTHPPGPYGSADVSISAGQRLPGVFAELIDAIIEGEHVAQILGLITRRSVELLEVTSAGIVVADPRGGYRVLAASDESADLAELFQATEEEGPALDVVAPGGASAWPSASSRSSTNEAASSRPRAYWPPT
jgi:hypothetical protein